MKSGKEIQILSSNKDFKIFAGAIENYKSPLNIYVNISSWVRLKEDPVKIESVIRLLKSNIKKIINKNVDGAIFDKKNIIVDFDISLLGLKNKKPAFLSIEISLNQKKGKMLPLVQLKTKPTPDLVPYINKITDGIVNSNIILNSKYLEFSKSKKYIKK